MFYVRFLFGFLCSEEFILFVLLSGVALWRAGVAVLVLCQCFLADGVLVRVSAELRWFCLKITCTLIRYRRATDAFFFRFVLVQVKCVVMAVM